MTPAPAIARSGAVSVPVVSLDRFPRVRRTLVLRSGAREITGEFYEIVKNCWYVVIAIYGSSVFVGRGKKRREVKEGGSLCVRIDLVEVEGVDKDDSATWRYDYSEDAYLAGRHFAHSASLIISTQLPLARSVAHAAYGIYRDLLRARHCDEDQIRAVEEEAAVRFAEASEGGSRHSSFVLAIERLAKLTEIRRTFLTATRTRAWATGFQANRAADDLDAAGSRYAYGEDVVLAVAQAFVDRFTEIGNALVQMGGVQGKFDTEHRRTRIIELIECLAAMPLINPWRYALQRARRELGEALDAYDAKEFLKCQGLLSRSGRSLLAAAPRHKVECAIRLMSDHVKTRVEPDGERRREILDLIGAANTGFREYHDVDFERPVRGQMARVTTDAKMLLASDEYVGPNMTRAYRILNDNIRPV